MNPGVGYWTQSFKSNSLLRRRTMPLRIDENEIFIYSKWHCSNELLLKLCGELGIRTLEALLELTRFPSVRLRPLGQLSFEWSAKLVNFIYFRQKL